MFALFLIGSAFGLTAFIMPVLVLALPPAPADQWRAETLRTSAEVTMEQQAANLRPPWTRPAKLAPLAGLMTITGLALYLYHTPMATPWVRTSRPGDGRGGRVRGAPHRIRILALPDRADCW